MESRTQVSRYVHQNSKKRVLPVGSPSSVCEDVEVLEITPTNRTSKPKSSREKEVTSCEIIDVDTDEDCGDVMIVDEVDTHRKGKEAMPNFSIGLGGLANDGSGSGFQLSTNSVPRLHDSMNIDDLNSSNFFGEDEWLDNYYDDLVYDDFASLESHLDHMDIPPGIEVPFPWLPSSPKYKIKVPVTSAATESSLQIQSDGVHGTPGLNSSNSSWPLPSAEVIDLSLSQSKTTIDTQANIGTQPSKVKLPFKLLESDLGQKKTTSSSVSHMSSQSSMGPSTLMPGKELFNSFGKSKRRTRASHAFYSGPSNQFPSGTTYPAIIPNNTSSYLKLKLPMIAPVMETYVPQWPDSPMNMMGPSMGSGPSGFTAEFVPWAQDAASSQNGASSMLTSVPTTVVQRNMDEVLQKFEVFRKFDTVEDSSDHHYSKNAPSDKQPPKNWAKKIQEEWKILEKDLPDTIFVRVYEARMDLLRAVIVGAEGTPYHDGLFFFDVFFPSSYPNVPPLVHYHSGGLRINPNLYNCGKVCLSLLNTWSGSHKEKWIPGVSTMLQVLVSIQGLILNAKPYFNEPGYANMSGSVSGEKRSLEYNEGTFIYSLQTMVYSMRRPPKHFEEFVIGHYCKYARDILVSCKAYLDGAQVGCLAKGGVQDVDEGDKSCSPYFKSSLAGYIPTLVNTFSQIGAKDVEEFLSLCQKANGPAPSAAPKPLNFYK